MHYKVASLLTMIYVTFIYGLFIPIMFPITLIGIFNTYMTEKICLIWLYRRPPMFDESLIQRTFAMLKYSPLFMFMFGYWAVGQPQIFESLSTDKVFSNRAGDPHHTLMPHHMNQAAACFLIFLYLVGDKIGY